jgi:hypothetical protein
MKIYVWQRLAETERNKIWYADIRLAETSGNRKKQDLVCRYTFGRD